MSAVTKNAETLERAVADLTQATAQLIRRVRAESNPDELGWSQLSIMARLERDGPSTTADLARADAMKPQSMGAILALLERDDLVERRPHPTDGRQILFSLTAKGLEARRKRARSKREWCLAAMAKLNASEQHTLIDASALILRLADS
jgi:DNA-binding MarR family transcriptional regulator